MKNSLKKLQLSKMVQKGSWDPFRTPSVPLHGALRAPNFILVAKNTYLHPTQPDQGQKSRKSRQIEFCHTLPIVLENCAVIKLKKNEIKIMFDPMLAET